MHLDARDVRKFLTLLGAGVLVVGCANARPTTNPGEVKDRSFPDASRVADWCEKRTDAVRCIAPGSGRHAIVVPARGKTRGLVFLDPGGPGLDLPDQATPVRTIIPRPIEEFDVAILVEPWVETEFGSDCLTGAAKAQPSIESCDLPSNYSPDDQLSELVDTIAVRLRQPVSGVYLRSFGATRSAGLLAEGAVNGLKWAVLESPGPRPGTSAATLFEARSKATESLLTSPCRDRRCASTIESNLNRFATVGVPGSATALEFALGVVALATLPSENAESIAMLRANLLAGKVQPQLGDELRRLGRRYELRGRSAAAPELIALWADTCPRLSQWDDVAAGQSPLTQAFAWTFRGCGAEGAGTFATTSSSVPVLLLTGKRDTIVPPSIQQLWTDLSTKTKEITGDAHSWDSSRITRAILDWIDKQS